MWKNYWRFWISAYFNWRLNALRNCKRNSRRLSGQINCCLRGACSFWINNTNFDKCSYSYPCKNLLNWWFPKSCWLSYLFRKNCLWSTLNFVLWCSWWDYALKMHEKSRDQWQIRWQRRDHQSQSTKLFWLISPSCELLQIIRQSSPH